jgi:hypothetical protein
MVASGSRACGVLDEHWAEGLCASRGERYPKRPSRPADPSSPTSTAALGHAVALPDNLDTDSEDQADLQASAAETVTFLDSNEGTIVDGCTNKATLLAFAANDKPRRRLAEIFTCLTLYVKYPNS